MKKIIVILLVFTVLITSVFSQQPRLRIKAGTYTPPYVPPTPIPGNTGAFTFTLGSQLATSAGVYRNDSFLVKTLWSDSVISGGTYTKYWDGKDDYGNVIPSPDASYKVKVLSNNVQYTWQGTIGNSSDSMTGNTKHRGYYYCMRGLVFSGSFGYFCTGYSEGGPSIAKFNIATPNQKIVFFNGSANYKADNNYVATDGSLIYWGAFDSNSPNNTFVYATNTSDALVTFSSGVNYTITNGNGQQYNCVSKQNIANSLLTGLAVQRTGSYLFVARGSLNQIQVLNKTTGALVSTLTFSNPTGLCVDSNDNLWMTVGGAIGKYYVGTGGAISSQVLALSGTDNPLSISYGNNRIAVCNAGTSQQVQFYDTSGVLQTTLGSAGGYATSSVVSNSKFYFSDLVGNKLPFVAYQSDNTYWVNDPGNYRVQHYNSSNAYVGRIMSLGSTYSVFPDKNNINRIYGGYLEFSTDYTTLTGSSGWALTNNWGANVTSAYDGFGQMRYITTLSNGRTYGFIRIGNDYEVVELVAGGQTRFTGVLVSLSSVLCDDGSRQDYTESGGTATLRRYPLSGFTSNNPTWSGTGELLATLPYNNNPVTFPNSQAWSGHRIAFFNYNSYLSNIGPVFTTGYHLAGATRGGSQTLYNTEKSTHRNYEGNYPEAGWFDIGNKVNNNAGGNVNIIGDDIITSYHGEFWKDGQTNKYNHYYKNGLALGQFGKTRYEVGFNNHAVAGMAGNALTPTLVPDGAGGYYLYHGDESDHSALHRWRITGLNTINEQVLTIPFPSAYVPPTLDYTNLMAGIPFDVAFTNVGAWTRHPSSGGGLTMNTSRFSYDKLKDNDVLMAYSNPSTVAVTDSVKVSLGSNNVTTNWKIVGNVAYPVNAANYGPTAQYMEVLDASGKILATMYPIRDLSSYPTINYRLKGNTLNLINITETGSSFNDYLRDLKYLEIICIGGAVTFNFGSYTGTTTISDGTGNWRTPTSIRFRFTTTVTGGGVEGANIVIQNLKFYKDY